MRILDLIFGRSAKKLKANVAGAVQTTNYAVEEHRSSITMISDGIINSGKADRRTIKALEELTRKVQSK